MILLKAHSLTQIRRVPVVKMPMVLKERETTASLVPESMSGITTESWFLDDTNPGKGIVYRVRSIQTAYDTNTPTIQLEHVIRCLADKLLFGEVTPQMMGGGTTCTAKQAVQYILKKSADWTLGKFDYASVTNAYKFDGDSLLDALEDVSKTLEDCRWTYDLTVYPFKLNIIKKDKSNPCELRPGRNLVTVTKTIDKTGMYTRFYPIGKNDLHLPGDGYVEKNTGTYDTVEKTEVDSTRETEDELRAWANQKLKIHAQPRVQIVAEGLNLSAATGEDLDNLTLGRTCRIPLEEFSTTIEEEIVELNYRDKKNEPEIVRVTLANEQEDIVRILANEIKEGAGPNGSGRGGGGRGGAKKAKEDNAWFEDTNEHVAMCARGIIGVDAHGNVNWERLSRLEVNADGIYGDVQVIQTDQVLMEGRLELTESNFNATVQAIGTDGKITAASICLAINNGGSSARISADHVILSGKTTINDVMTVSSGRVQIKTPLRVEGNAMVESLTLRGGGSGITLDDSDLATTIKSASVNGNTLTLTPYRGEPINFSKATSLSGAWSSGVFTVTASPQGNSILTSLAPGAATWDGRTGTLTIYATIGTSGAVYNTGKEVTVVYPASTWSYSNLSENNGGYSGSKFYDLDTRYTYHAVTVTVDGESRTLVFRT